MAHPYAGHRQSGVEKDRARTLVKDYRTGGAVIPPLRPGAKELPAPVRKALAGKGKMSGPGGAKAKGRMDKAPRGPAVTDFEKSKVGKKMQRATGGRAILDDLRGDAITDNAGDPVAVPLRRGARSKGPNVNVIINGAGGQPQPQPVPVPVPVSAGGPPMAGAGPAVPPSGPGPMPMQPPSGIPAGMPIIGRKKGGRVVQAPGNMGTGAKHKVKVGNLAPRPPDQGVKDGKVDPVTGKGGGKPRWSEKPAIERRRGGAVPMDAGAGSGVGRLEEVDIYRNKRLRERSVA